MANTNIDIQAVLDLMKNSLLVFVNSKKPEVINAATGYFEQGKERLTQLAQDMLSGELSYKFGVERLKEEKENVIDQLLSIEQMVASDIQEIANKVVDIFRNAIDGVIGGLQGINEA